MEEYINEIAQLWESCWVTNGGEKHQQLEKMLSEYFDVPNVTLFANGHLALENTLAAMELTGEVITTPFTFVSTTNAIVRNGLKPAFCDIDPVSYTIDAKKIEALITPETSAIVPVHVYGNICNVKEIERVANEHGLKIIYDAAHAFGEVYEGKSAASFGDVSMFSFHATKVFNSVEGGCVACKNNELQQKLNCMKNFGILGQDRIVYPGGNAKMSELHAAMGICNLRHVDEYIDKRRAIVERYRENLKGINGIVLNAEQKDLKPNYAYFPVVFDGGKYNRDRVAAKLAEQNIFARKYFSPLTNDNECFGFNGSSTPVAKHISECVLTLPLYPDLSVDSVDRICEIITD